MSTNNTAAANATSKGTNTYTVSSENSKGSVMSTILKGLGFGLKATAKSTSTVLYASAGIADLAEDAVLKTMHSATVTVLNDEQAESFNNSAFMQGANAYSDLTQKGKDFITKEGNFFDTFEVSSK